MEVSEYPTVDTALHTPREIVGLIMTPVEDLFANRLEISYQLVDLFSQFSKQLMAGETIPINALGMSRFLANNIHLFFPSPADQPFIQISELISQDEARVIAFNRPDEGTDITGNVSNIENSPCKHIAQKNGCRVTNAVEEYPDNEFFNDADIHSYIGFPVRIGDQTLVVSLMHRGNLDTEISVKGYADYSLRGKINEIYPILSLLISAKIAQFGAAESYSTEPRILETVIADTLQMGLQAHDRESELHCNTVSELALALASRYNRNQTEENQLTYEELHDIDIAGRIHDIGKVAVPADEIINKHDPDTRLTDTEYELIKHHTSIGARIAQACGFNQRIVELIESHHENYDGSGYPKSTNYTINSTSTQILRIADSVAAMTENRIYNSAANISEIIRQLNEGSGTSYNPELVMLMVDILNESKPDSF
jgi:putative nucleotidyltransferase with HDIG domain